MFMYSSVPIVLVGNKTDLYVDRMITTEQGKRLADSWHAAFLETSAKQNEVRFFSLFLIILYEYNINCHFISVCRRYFSYVIDRD